VPIGRAARRWPHRGAALPDIGRVERAEEGNLAAAQFLTRLILGAAPPLLSELPAELLPDPAAEAYVPPGPTLEDLARRARVEALISIMRGDDADDPVGGGT
jgi:hypothetical protein